MAQAMHCYKTKIPTLYPMIYPKNEKPEYSFPLDNRFPAVSLLNCRTLQMTLIFYNLLCILNLICSWRFLGFLVECCETNLSLPVKVLLLTVSRWSFFCGLFLLFVFRVCHIYCLFIVALWSPAGKG